MRPNVPCPLFPSIFKKGKYDPENLIEFFLLRMVLKKISVDARSYLFDLATALLPLVVHFRKRTMFIMLMKKEEEQRRRTRCIWRSRPLPPKRSLIFLPDPSRSRSFATCQTTIQEDVCDPSPNRMIEFWGQLRLKLGKLCKEAFQRDIFEKVVTPWRRFSSPKPIAFVQLLLCWSRPRRFPPILSLAWIWITWCLQSRINASKEVERFLIGNVTD